MLQRLAWPCFHNGERCAEALHPVIEVFSRLPWVIFTVLPVTEAIAWPSWVRKQWYLVNMAEGRDTGGGEVLGINAVKQLTDI